MQLGIPYYREPGIQGGFFDDDVHGLSMEDIEKALATDGTVGSDGSPMIGESLDPVVKRITLDKENFTPKLRRFYTFDANSIIEEFSQIDRLGLAEMLWHAEGNLGVQDSAKYNRITFRVRTMGVTFAVTHTMQRAGRAKFGDIKALEAVQHLTQLLLTAERDLWWARSDMNPHAVDGILKQAPTDTKRFLNKAATGTAGSRTTYTGGGVLTIEDVRNNAIHPLRYGGHQTALYCAPEEKVTLSQAQDSQLRWYQQNQNSPIAVGMVMDRILNDFGYQGGLDLVWDYWLSHELGREFDEASDPSGEFHADVPAAPAAPTVTAVNTGFTNAPGYLPNDVYYYGVCAVGDVGEGPIVMQSSGATADNTNGGIRVRITHPAHLAKINSYRIFRSTANGTDYSKMRLVGEIAKPSAAVVGGTLDFYDDGSFVPGSRRAVQIDEMALSLGQLLPPRMRDIADVDNTHRSTIEFEWGIGLYDSGNRISHYKNIGGDVAGES